MASPEGEEAARRRRTAPHERRLSSYSAFLLLLTIVQAAFGYAFLGPAADNQGLRYLHVAVGVTLLVLAFLFHRALGAHPERGARERLIAAVLRFYLGLALFQALSGVVIGGYVPGIRLPLTGTHLGLGLLLPFLALIMHMAAVMPSLHLSARKEHAHALEDWRRLQAAKAGADDDAALVPDDGPGPGSGSGADPGSHDAHAEANPHSGQGRAARDGCADGQDETSDAYPDLPRHKGPPPKRRARDPR